MNVYTAVATITRMRQVNIVHLFLRKTVRYSASESSCRMDLLPFELGFNASIIGFIDGALTSLLECGLMQDCQLDRIQLDKQMVEEQREKQKNRGKLV